MYSVLLLPGDVPPERDSLPEASEAEVGKGEANMNEVIENLETRRSGRNYKPDMVPREVLDQIIEAGTYAPTGMGRQSPIIVAVTNRERRE